MRGKLSAVGLIQKREQATLGTFLEGYIQSRCDTKPRTVAHLRRAQQDLLDCLGADKQLKKLTPGDGDEFRLFLLGKGLAENTVRRRCGRAKQFFTAAVRRRLIPSNPFVDLKSAVQGNPDRFVFVTRETTQKVIDACPDAEWRLIVALSRYGGLRCPSEHLALRLTDIDWEHSRLRVPSPKTEHHAGGESRLIPIFPELRPYLEEIWEAAQPGQEYAITRYRDSNSNLRTQLQRIIRRAGVDEWEKPFQNMRSTRETELAESFPIHVVCRWIGNSQPVASRHYLQLTDEHFQRAIEPSGQRNSTTYAAHVRRSIVSSVEESTRERGNREVGASSRRESPLRPDTKPCDKAKGSKVLRQAPRQGLEPWT